MDELRSLVRERFKLTPSLDEIAARARQLMIAAVTVELLKPVPSAA